MSAKLSRAAGVGLVRTYQTGVVSAYSPVMPADASLPDRLLSALHGPCGVAPGTPVAVGVSGGADSVTLLRVLHAAGVPVTALHVDHGLRPSSADDAAFVAGLASDLGVPHASRRVQVAPGNRAAEARRARYAALVAMADRRPLAVAHTATDQAETVLMALVRGAGLAGLGGMPERRVLAGGAVLARPMLDVTRAEVEAHARAHGWAWRDDPTNALGVRGRLRRDVLPALDALGGAATARRVARASAAVRAARPTALADAFVSADGRVDPAIGALPEAVRHAVWAEAVARIAPAARRSAALVARLDALLDAPVGRRMHASGVLAQRTDNGIDLSVDQPDARV